MCVLLYINIPETCRNAETLEITGFLSRKDEEDVENLLGGLLMYIINTKGEIFNTECIQQITTDGVHVFAVFNNTPRTISYNPETIRTIADAIKKHRDYVEVD
jgi:hypothetical protein